MALLSGIEETKILEIKKEEIHQKASQSIKEKGWLPTSFRSIVSRAKELLKNTSLPISEISYLTGFANESNFIYFFKKHEGISPLKFRKLLF